MSALVLLCSVLVFPAEPSQMIEARTGKSGLEWQNKFAPMSVCPLEGLCKERVVWSLGYRPPGDPDGIFYNRVFEPLE